MYAKTRENVQKLHQKNAKPNNSTAVRKLVLTASDFFPSLHNIWRLPSSYNYGSDPVLTLPSNFYTRGSGICGLESYLQQNVGPNRKMIKMLPRLITRVIFLLRKPMILKLTSKVLMKCRINRRNLSKARYVCLRKVQNTSKEHTGKSPTRDAEVSARMEARMTEVEGALSLEPEIGHKYSEAKCTTQILKKKIIASPILLKILTESPEFSSQDGKTVLTSVSKSQIKEENVQNNPTNISYN